MGSSKQRPIGVERFGLLLHDGLDELVENFRPEMWRFRDWRSAGRARIARSALRRHGSFRPCFSKSREFRPPRLPIVKRRGLEVGAVRPDQGTALLVEQDAIEVFGVAERTEDLAVEDGTKIDHLTGPILELDAEREGPDLLETRDGVGLVRHRFIPRAQF